MEARPLQVQLSKAGYEEPTVHFLASHLCCAQGRECHRLWDRTELWVGRVDGWVAVWDCHRAAVVLAAQAGSRD